MKSYEEKYEEMSKRIQSIIEETEQKKEKSDIYVDRSVIPTGTEKSDMGMKCESWQLLVKRKAEG